MLLANCRKSESIRGKQTYIFYWGGLQFYTSVISVRCAAYWGKKKYEANVAPLGAACKLPDLVEATDCKKNMERASGMEK